MRALLAASVRARAAGRGLARGRRRDRAGQRPFSVDRRLLAVMDDLQGGALEQRVGRLLVRDLHQQPPPAEAEAEREPRERLGQAGREAEDPVVVSHPSKPRDGADPCPGERRDVQPVARVVLEVVEVDQGGLARGSRRPARGGRPRRR